MIAAPWEDPRWGRPVSVKLMDGDMLKGFWRGTASDQRLNLRTVVGLPISGSTRELLHVSAVEQVTLLDAVTKQEPFDP